MFGQLVDAVYSGDTITIKKGNIGTPQLQYCQKTGATTHDDPIVSNRNTAMAHQLQLRHKNRHGMVLATVTSEKPKNKILIP